MQRVAAAGSRPPAELHTALTATVAAQLLGFDLAQQSRLDGNIADNTSWLDVTHGITFAEAALAVCTRQPALWPQALLQIACFSGRNRGFVAREPLPLDTWRAADPDAFIEAESERLFDHGCDEFIVSAHRIKTLLAAEQLARQASDDGGRELFFASVNRYVNSPLKLKHARRTVRQASRFVALDG